MRFRAAIDGGSRGNPGPAAWGVAVLGADGSPVEGHAGFLGRATNNVAEYHALLEALRLATQLGADEVELRADSELVVQQLLGNYRVKHPDLKPLFAEARQLIGGFVFFRIEHVPRERNREADRLVRTALDHAEADPAAARRIHLVFDAADRAS
ncbi:MAG TPA: ribonuclease HI family protein [Candidatus Polarisedimenticolaceae bacterium]|nr:ribonuclease HI family protein [Candidatus Polarisedimenticolaceae bacterium]